MRRGRQLSGAPGPMRSHSPCGVTRVTQWLTLLLAMLAGGARAQQGPSVILGSGILYFTEAGPPVWVDRNLLIEAPSADYTCTQAKIIVTHPAGTPQPQLDVLAASTLNGISNSWNPTLYTLTFTPTTGSANYLDFQTVLRTLNFTNPSKALSPNTRTIRYEVTGSNNIVGMVSRLINIAPLNDPPEVRLTRTEVGFTEGSELVLIDPNMVLYDADSLELISVTVQITDGYEQGEFGDSLECTQTPSLLTDDSGNLIGMQQEFIPSTGTLVVSRAGGLPYQKSTFEMLLRTLAFRNPSQNPIPGDRNLTFFATDSAGSGPTSHLTVRFTDVNQAPTIIELDPSPIIILEGERHYISTNLFIADIDNSIMQGARVALSGAFETTDIIHCNRTHVEINCNYDPATGIMLLTGAANISTYEYVMQRLEFYTVGGASHSGTRFATFQITDGLNYGEGRVRNLVVTAINNGPILNGIPTDVGYNGLGPFFIQAGLILTDADDTSIEAARVEITTGFDPEVDRLQFVVPAGYPITYVYDQEAGTINFQGVDTPGHYQEILRSVAIYHLGESASTNRIVTMWANDGREDSFPLARRVWAFDFGETPVINSVTTSSTAGETVTFRGAHFGPVFPNVVNFVQIGAEECTNIVVTVENLELTCQAPGGTGANVTVSLAVNDVRSPNYDIFQYRPPSIDVVSSPRTQGGPVTLTGANFGPEGSSRIGSVLINGIICVNPIVTIAHFEVVCGYPAGAGRDQDVVITTGGQSSGTTGAGKFSFQPPNVTEVVDGSHAGFLATIYGSNFGPMGTAYASVRFEHSALWTNASLEAEFNCTDARVTVSHTTITCNVPPMYSADAGPFTTNMSLAYTAIVQIDNQDSGKTNMSSGFEQMYYLPSVLTNVTTVNMWGGYVTLTGEHLGPPGTEFTLEFGLSNDATDADFTTYSLNSSFWWTPRVTVRDTEALVVVPDYVTVGASMDPFLRILTNSYRTETLEPVVQLYEPPEITANASGSHLGNCGGSCNDENHIITLWGKNFAPDLNYTEEEHGEKNSIGTKDSKFAQVYIDGEFAADNEVFVYNSTMLTFTATPANDEVQKITQEGNITLYMLCSGNDLNLCQNTGNTGDKSFAYLPPVVTEVTSTDTGGEENEITVIGMFFGNSRYTFFDNRTYPDAGVFICVDEACTITENCYSENEVNVYARANARSDSRIRCRLPPSSIYGTAYSATVRLTMGNLTTELENAYSYNGPLLANVSDTSTLGGMVQLIGSNFGAHEGGIEVYAEGTNTNYTCSNPKLVVPHFRINCTFEAGVGKNLPVTVTVTAPNGVSKSVTKSLGLTYFAPEVYSCSSVPTSGGTVTIDGQYFGNDVSLITATVDGVALENITLMSDSQITGDMSEGGWEFRTDRMVSVTVDRQTGENNVFTYVLPELTAVVTPAPTMFGPGTITLEGTSFGPMYPAQNYTNYDITISGTPAVTARACQMTINHTQMVCETSGCAPESCGDAARDVLLRIDVHNTSDSGNGILTFAGPEILYMYGKTSGQDHIGYVSMFGGDADTLVIIGRNFGKTNENDGSTLDWVAFCPKASTLDCGVNDWYNMTDKANKVQDQTRINAFLPLSSGYNHSLMVQIGGVNSSTTGDSVIKGYLGPVATSVRLPSAGVPTSGNTITVLGVRFGPVGTQYISHVLWGISSGTPRVYTAAQVDARVTSESTTLTFFTPESTADTNGVVDFQVEMTNGALPAQYFLSGLLEMTYDPPTIISTSTVPTSGGDLYINGTSFGPLGYVVGDVSVGNCSATACYTCKNGVVVVAHRMVKCSMPPGTGLELSVSFIVDGQNSSSWNGWEVPTFSYADPVITSVGTIGTNEMRYWSAVHRGFMHVNYTFGPWLTITGQNFGFMFEAVNEVTVGGQPCMYPFVTVNHTEIQCLLGDERDLAFGSGSGSGYTVFLELATTQNTTLANAFTYSNPSISQLSPSGLFGNQTITLTGLNFGCAPPTYWPDGTLKGGRCLLPPSAEGSIASATIAGRLATNVTVIDSRTVTLVTPPVWDLPSIYNLPIVMHVDGLSTTGAVYSYSPPSILTVSEASIFGGVVTVTGLNFGPVGNTHLNEVMMAERLLELSVALPNVTVEGTQMTFVAPAGRGVNLNVKLGIATEDTGLSGNFKLNYAGPRITHTTGGSTAGGPLTIHGHNFGPVGSANLNTVTVRGAPCVNATVTVENEAIVCVGIPGTGGGYDVSLRISDETDQRSGLGKYNYSVPVITAIEPMDAPPGSLITIVGDAFGPNIEDVEVTVGGVPCLSIAYIEEHYQLLCETSLLTGANKLVLVTVDGLTSTDNFFSYHAPVITSVSVGPTVGGMVTITGLYFGALGGEDVDSVMLGAAECADPVVTILDTEIVCEVGSATQIGLGGDFTLENLDGDGRMDAVVTIGGQSSGESSINAFAFSQCKVTGATNMNTLYAGEQVTLTGSGFGTKDNGDPETDPLKITVGGYDAVSYRMVRRDTSISFGAPVALGQLEELYVSVNGRDCDVSAVADLAFSYGPPVVDAELMGTPPGTAGGIMTIGGKGFGPVGSSFVTSVRLGRLAQSATAVRRRLQQMTQYVECYDPVVTVADVRIECTIPEGQGAAGDLLVVVAGQDSGNTGAGAFSFAYPTLNFSSPAVINAGGWVYLFGTNFGTTEDAITVTLQGAAHLPGEGFECHSVLLVEKHLRIRCTAGIGVGNDVQPVVDVGGQNTSLTNTIGFNLTYTNPYITSVSPSDTEGGASNGPVSINGGGFGPAGERWNAFFNPPVLLGGRECTDPIVTIDDTQVQCMPPPGTGTNLDAYLRMGGLDTGITGNRLFSYLPPLITSMSSLPTSGGQTTVTGRNFGPPSRNMTLRVFTGEQCNAGQPPADFYGETGCTKVQGLGVISNVLVRNHRELVALLPGGTGKDYDVRLLLNGLDSGVSGNNMFGYQPPVVTRVFPQQQPSNPEAGFMITITGVNFGRSPEDVNKVDVIVGTRYCDRNLLRVVPSLAGAETEIFAVPPYGAGVDLPVFVQVDGQRSDENSVGRFSYVAPVVMSTTPTATAGGTTTITGFNFGPVGPVYEVEVAGQPCTEARVATADVTIECEVGAGTGKDRDVFVRIANSSATAHSADTGVGKFRYLAPVITNVNPLTAKSGGTITVAGRNFGPGLSTFRLDIGWPATIGGLQAGVWSSEVYTMQRAHQVFRAQVPVGFGTGLPVLVNVDGQYPDDYLTAPNPYIFNYDAPKITAASNPPTGGGILTLTGMDLGPANVPGAVDAVQVRDWQSQIQTCADPVVTEDNSQVQCMLGPGVGKSLDVQISTGGQLSDWERVLSYSPPQILNLQPVQVAMGMPVTITGVNFGANASHIEFFFNEELLPSDSFYVSVPHTQVILTMPLGTGAQKGFRLRTPVDLERTQPYFHAQPSIPSVPTPTTSVTVSFKVPEVHSFDPPPTPGGNVTLYGDHFGPLGSERIATVMVANQPCTNAVVVEANTAIRCVGRAGSGTNLPVIVVIDGQTSALYNNFSYAPPTVERFDRDRAFPGDPLVIVGASFGTVAGDITVMIGQQECTAVVLLVEHTEIRCTVGVSQGMNQSVVVTVRGVEGPPLSRQRFRYQKSGCPAREAENYDPAVTDDDGSCRILGCTKQESSNYNPFATVDDGSCVREAEIVSMKVRLDYYNEYLTDSDRYDAEFAADVARQVDIRVARIVVEKVAPGSTIFTFQILDDAEDRAQDVAIRLEKKVLDNEWDHSKFVLLQLKWEDSTLGTVDTKQDEPRVSTVSIIGLVVGAAVVVLWLVFWRKALLRVAQNCCGDEYDDEIEQQLAMETGGGGGTDAEGLKTSAAMRPPRTGVSSSSRSSQVQPLALPAASTRT